MEDVDELKPALPDAARFGNDVIASAPKNGDHHSRLMTRLYAQPRLANDWRLW